ncbi:chemotaxis protein CheW [Caproiciproducens sp.]
MELQDKLHTDEPVDASQERYLTFLTDQQLFALPITEIVQIAQMQEIILMPDQSDYVKGVINLRGQIIPVIDVRLRFGKPEAAYTERTCIIITNVRNSDFGLIVDEVDEVVDIETEQISAPPKINAGASRVNDYLTGIARLKSADGQKERVALLLHAGKILGESEFAAP